MRERSLHYQGELIAIKELKDEKSRSEKAYNVELDALQMVQKLDHERIVKFVAGFEQYGQRYLMFQWVDGGNLREFWEQQPWTRNKATIRWALNELKGLAEALDSWHNYDPDPSSQRFCRHGDLKPENIVRDQRTGGRGKFLIADMGLAKIHTQPTHVRRTPSWGLTGTLRYQAPELSRLSPQISRSIDIWSFGCILLEFIIWLLYGYKALHTFNTSLSELSNRFYIFDDQEVRFHPTVQRWIDHMMNTSLPRQGPSVSGALRDMLRLIYSRLLIEDPESNGVSTPVVNDDELHTQGAVPIITTIADEENIAVPHIPRAKIGEVCEALSKIVANADSEYIYDPTFPMNAQNGSGPQSRQLSLHESTTNFTKLRQQQQGQNRLDSGFASESAASASTQHPYVTPELSDTWEIYTDNQFANDVFRSLNQKDILEFLPAEATSPLELCENCSKKDGGILFGRGYSSHMSDIERTRHTCSLCRILFDTSASGVELTYYRNGSSLTTSKNGPPVWSLVLGPGKC
jgi:serine/threonine protein kinase